MHLAVVSLLLLFFISPAFSQPFPRAYVFTEKQDAKDTSCQLRREAAVAAVESVLRSNRVELVPRLVGAVKVYVNFTSVTTGNGCAVSYEVTFKDYQIVPLTGTGKAFHADVVYCTRAGVMSGPPYDLQHRLLGSYRQLTEECLSEIERGG
jgi:hypothetical protein